MKSFVALLVLGVLSSNIDSTLSSSIITGKHVDTLARFPHHVTVRNTMRYGGERLCSASIIDERFLLTSLRCVSQGISLRLDFHRKMLYDPVDSFSITVDNSSVIKYPTEFDDIALIKLPITLPFTRELRPVYLHDGKAPIETKLGIMVGFPPGDPVLSYGMYRILTRPKCKQLLGRNYDEYLQICALPWNRNYQIPCGNNNGSALIVGWPKDPQLVGVFSSSIHNCSNQFPVVYTRVPEYLDRIYDVLGVIATRSTGTTENTTPSWPYPTPSERPPIPTIRTTSTTATPTNSTTESTSRSWS